MRVYEVQAGDTPASIAAQPQMAGCPKCARDLIAANPHKASVTMPNGFVTFRDLAVGERLNLPEKWFDGSLDARPPSYFAALPYHDGLTPSTLGSAAAGILGDYTALDAASASVDALAQLSDQEFTSAVDAAGVLIGSAVSEATRGTNPAASGYAQDANAGVYWAKQRALEMAAAIEAGDLTAAAGARPEIQNVLATAMGSARLALQALYGGAQQTAAGGFPANVVAAAQSVAAAVATDAGYCASVARPGTPVNAAVHAFKTAWNASQTPLVPVNTGNYEQAVADALTRVIGSAPAACGARVTPVSPPVSPPPSSPSLLAVTPPQSEGLSKGAIFGIGLLGAGAVGGAIYLATNRPKLARGRPRVRRVSPLPTRGFP